MYKENQRHRQMTIYGIVHQFPIGVMKRLDKSWAPVFRSLIFEKINEDRYAGLYSTIDSRPNFPVNIWVGLEILKYIFDYTDEELLDQFHFNLLMARALGQDNLGDITLSERTIYYNRKRLLEYEVMTGRNLLEEEFKAISSEAVAKLSISTKTQRMDSSMIGSYIRQMSRLELIVKVLQNLYRDLPEIEQQRWKGRLGEYIEDEAEHIGYQLKRAQVAEHLWKLGGLLFEMHEAYADVTEINSGKSYEHVNRILSEQYNIVARAEQTIIEVKPSQEISAASLQNPADDSATFRRKYGTHQGDLLNVAETCDPENPVQILTDISVHTNVTTDDAILACRVAEIKERTGVEEMIVDGGYSGEESEDACNQMKVSLIPTEVKGRKLSPDKMALADFEFNGNQLVACPEGYAPEEIITKQEKGQYIVHFAVERCATCPHRKACLARCGKKYYSLTYSDRQLLLSRRRRQLGEDTYRAKCLLRPAVEGTISQFKRHLHNGKMRIRGLGRIRNSLILMAIGINFNRMRAYFQGKKAVLAAPLTMTILFLLFNPMAENNRNYRF